MKPSKFIPQNCFDIHQNTNVLWNFMKDQAKEHETKGVYFAFGDGLVREAQFAGKSEIYEIIPTKTWINIENYGEAKKFLKL